MFSILFLQSFTQQLFALIRKDKIEFNSNPDIEVSSNLSDIVASSPEVASFLVAVYAVEKKKFVLGNQRFIDALSNNALGNEGNKWESWYCNVEQKDLKVVKRAIDNFLLHPFENQFLTLKYHIKYSTASIYYQHEIIIRRLEGELYAINYILDISEREKIESFFEVSENIDERIVIAKKSKKLSPRQKEVLQLISDGYNSKEIADLLCISGHTVITHRKNLMEKFEAKNTAQLIKKVWSSISSI